MRGHLCNHCTMGNFQTQLWLGQNNSFPSSGQERNLLDNCGGQQGGDDKDNTIASLSQQIYEVDTAVIPILQIWKLVLQQRSILLKLPSY